MKCPHCDIHIDEHEALPCLNAWVADALGFIGDDQRIKLFHPDWYPEGAPPTIWVQYPVEIDAPNDDGGGWSNCYTIEKRFSFDIAAAWQVVEKMCGEEVDDNMLTLKGQGPDEEEVGWWWAKIAGVEGKDYIGEADTAPLAICRAAIKAVNNNV